ncbi:MAG: hypothetical protein V4474_03650 [Patescibacteria group bacterium]
MATEIDDIRNLAEVRRKESRTMLILSLSLGAAVLIGSYVYGVFILHQM